MCVTNRADRFTRPKYKSVSPISESAALAAQCSGQSIKREEGLAWAYQTVIPPLPFISPLLPTLVRQVLSMHPTYCGLCDMWFSSQRSFDAHLVLNERHPSCDKCDRKFADRLAYQKVGFISQLSLLAAPPSRFKVQRSLKPNNATDSTWCSPQSITIVRTVEPITTAL